MNNDGLSDLVEVKIAVNLPAASIRNVAIMQTIVYSIKDNINADIKTRLFNQFAIPGGFKRLNVQGEL